MDPRLSRSRTLMDLEITHIGNLLFLIKNPNQTSTGPGNIFKLEHWNVGGLRNNPNGKLAGFHNIPNRKLDGPNSTLY